MKRLLDHLPFWLVVALILLLGLTDLALSADYRPLATLLAPILWLGFYWMGRDQSAARVE